MLKSLTFKKDEGDQINIILSNISEKEIGIIKDDVIKKEKVGKVNERTKGEIIASFTIAAFALFLIIVTMHFNATYNQIPAKELSLLSQKYPLNHNENPPYREVSTINFKKAFEAIRNSEILVVNNISEKTPLQIYNNLTIWKNNTGTTFYTTVPSSTVLSWINEYVNINETLNYIQHKEPYNKVTNAIIQKERLKAYHSTGSFNFYSNVLLVLLLIALAIISLYGIYLTEVPRPEIVIFLVLLGFLLFQFFEVVILTSN